MDLLIIKKLGKIFDIAGVIGVFLLRIGLNITTQMNMGMNE
jgi:hypothetical protein